MLAGLLSGPALAAGVGDQAELGGQHHLVPAALQRAADEFLVGVGAVDLGGVDEGDAQLQGAVDGAHGLVVVGAGAGVAVGHAHRAQADAGDVQVTQADVLHGDPVLRSVGGRLDRQRRAGQGRTMTLRASRSSIRR